MSFGHTPDTILYEIVFSLGAFVAIGVIGLVGTLLRRLLRIRSGSFTLLFTAVVTIGTILGLSLYLDRMGTPVTATVTQKVETIHVRDEGDWWQQYRVAVRYTLPDGTQPLAQFDTTAARFDRAHEGGTVAVRSVSINNWVNLVRFADQSTWTWLPWRWLINGLVVVVAGWLAWQLLKVSGGWLLVVIALLAVGTLPFLKQYNLWRAANDPSRTPQTATGQIEEVHEVKTIDPFPGDSADGDEWETAMDVAQRYAIVVVRYTPQGYSEAIRGVDAVDLDEHTTLKPGATVDLRYATADARTVRLLGFTRNHYIRNPLAWLREQTLLIAFALGLLALVGWLGNRLRRFLRSRAALATDPARLHKPARRP